MPLPDLIAVGLLLRAFPEDVVDAVLGDLELREGRRRLLPARLVVYDVMAMGLFPDEPYQQVMRSVSAGAAWAVGATAESGFPSKVALAKARRRLGHEPLRALFERAARTPSGPVVAPDAVGGRVVVTLTTHCLGLADTAANAAAFGRAGAVHGSGSPRLRIVGLVESGSQTVLDVALGSTFVGVRALAATLGRALRPGDLVVLDRGCVSPRLLADALSVGADLLWPADPAAVLMQGKRFEDGSYLSALHAKASAGRAVETALPVRVLDGIVGTPTGTDGSASRLMTSVLNPDDVPAEALRGLSVHRHGLDGVFEALTGHRDGERLVIRSKTPDGVLQEVYGLLCLYHALRYLVVGRSDATK